MAPAQLKAAVEGRGDAPRARSARNESGRRGTAGRSRPRPRSRISPRQRAFAAAVGGPAPPGGGRPPGHIVAPWRVLATAPSDFLMRDVRAPLTPCTSRAKSPGPQTGGRSEYAPMSAPPHVPPSENADAGGREAPSGEHPHGADARRQRPMIARGGPEFNPGATPPSGSNVPDRPPPSRDVGDHDDRHGSPVAPPTPRSGGRAGEQGPGRPRARRPVRIGSRGTARAARRRAEPRPSGGLWITPGR